MIVNGASRCSISFWTRHLQDRKTNDRAEIKEIRALGAENLRDAMLEMQSDASHTRLENFMYIADFSPTADERLTEEQWQRAFEIFEKHRGIPEGQSRVVIEHEKEGRVHRHVVWSRVDLEKLKAWRDDYDAPVCHAASKEISEELGLHRSESPYDKDREGERGERNPKHWEMFRGMKSGLDPRDITAEVTAVYRDSMNAPDFIAGLEEHGYSLVRGDRRNFCILDEAGDIHSLARRLQGVKSKELTAFMAGVDMQDLPTVEQAKEGHRAKINAARVDELGDVQKEIAWEEALAKAAIEKEKVERRFAEPTPFEEREAARAKEKKTLKGMSATLDTLYKTSFDNNDFIAELNHRKMTFACATKAEAEESYRKAQFARAAGNFAVSFKEGDIVAIKLASFNFNDKRDDPSKEHRLYRLDQTFANDLLTRLEVEKKDLSSVNELKTAFNKIAEADRERRQAVKPPTNMTVKLAELLKWSKTNEAFLETLEAKHIDFAQATKEEAERSHREAEFARAVGRYAVSFKEGEIVAVTTPRTEYRQEGQIVGLAGRVRRLDQDFARDLVAKLKLQDRLKSIEEVKPILDKKADADEKRWEKIREENATLKDPMFKPERMARSVWGATKRAGRSTGKSLLFGLKGLDRCADAFDSLFLPKMTPRQLAASEIAQMRRDAEAEAASEIARDIPTEIASTEMLRGRNGIERERGRDR